jgi:Bacterial extracellular solute-binding proteins, family 3
MRYRAKRERMHANAASSATQSDSARVKERATTLELSPRNSMAPARLPNIPASDSPVRCLNGANFASILNQYSILNKTSISHHYCEPFLLCLPSAATWQLFAKRRAMGAVRTLFPGVLTIGAYTSFAPVVWAENGAAHGKDIHFLRAFAREKCLVVDVRFFEFDRIWERPLRKQVDIAAGGIAPTRRRCASGLAWSSPYHTVQRSLVVRKEDSAQLQTIADFGGRIIAVTRGSTAHLDAQRRKPSTARIVYFERQENAIQDLCSGRIAPLEPATSVATMWWRSTPIALPSAMCMRLTHRSISPLRWKKRVIYWPLLIRSSEKTANATHRFLRRANGLITRSNQLICLTSRNQSSRAPANVECDCFEEQPPRTDRRSADVFLVPRPFRTSSGRGRPGLRYAKMSFWTFPFPSVRRKSRSAQRTASLS